MRRSTETKNLTLRGSAPKKALVSYSFDFGSSVRAEAAAECGHRNSSGIAPSRHYHLCRHHHHTRSSPLRQDAVPKDFPHQGQACKGSEAEPVRTPSTIISQISSIQPPVASIAEEKQNSSSSSINIIMVEVIASIAAELAMVQQHLMKNLWMICQLRTNARQI